jgi:hypothetical protein
LRCTIVEHRDRFAASCRELQAGGLRSPEDYFGAREPTIFSKRGSLLNGYFLSFGISK